MRRPNADHVVLVMPDSPAPTNRSDTMCRHCGEHLVIELPISVGAWVAAVQSFIRIHERCPAPSST